MSQPHHISYVNFEPRQHIHEYFEQSLYDLFKVHPQGCQCRARVVLSQGQVFTFEITFRAVQGVVRAQKTVSQDQQQGLVRTSRHWQMDAIDETVQDLQSQLDKFLYKFR